jgi:GAF domain-containing protein
MSVPASPDGQDRDHDFAQLHELLLSTSSFEGFLTDLVQFAASWTRHACSLTVRNSPRSPYTAAGSDERTVQLDERQYAGRQGPCLEALAKGVPVLVADMASEGRWAPYPRQAVAMGVRSSMSYPLISGSETLGALNMYAFNDVPVGDDVQARARQLADRAAGVLAVALRMADSRQDNDNLRAALTSRSVIDQAMGVLMGQQRCTAQEAFDLLRTTSQNRNLKLRDVAARIVASAQSGGSRPGPPTT